MGLSLAKLARGRESYYLEAVANGSEDLRVRGDDPPGVWLGGGAQAMGLSGSVRGADLSVVLAGLDPDTGQVLNRRSSSVRISAYDATFAVPKSVSVLWAVSPDSVRAGIQAGHDASVAAAMGHLEHAGALARRGSGPNRRQVGTTGLIAAAFPHRTSRALDPYLHTHVVIANLVQGIDGNFSAIDARGLFAHASTGGDLYQAQLRFELRHRLGISWGPLRGGSAQIEGIPSEVNRHFARRRQQVEEWLSRPGPYGGESRRRGELAALSTRPSKDLAARLEDLLPRWRAEAATLGLDRDRLDRLLDEGRSSASRQDQTRLDYAHLPFGDQDRFEALSRRLLGPSYLTASRATFNRRDVLRGWCRVLGDGAPVTHIEALANKMLDGPNVVVLSGRSLISVLDSPRTDQGWRKRGGGWTPTGSPDQRWTTPELLATQRSLKDRAERLDRIVGANDAEQVTAARMARSLALAPEQSPAVKALVGSNAGLIMAEGRADNGSLDSLASAKEMWARAGVSVLGTAPTAFEAEQLRAGTGMAIAYRAEFSSDSTFRQVSRTLRDGPWGRDGGPGVIVVMRADGFGVADLDAIMARAERLTARVVLVGRSDRFEGLVPSDGRASRPEHVIKLDRVTTLDGGSFQIDDQRSGTNSLAQLRGQLVSDWGRARQAGQTVVMAAVNRHEVDQLCGLARSIGAPGHEPERSEPKSAQRAVSAAPAVLAWQARDLRVDRVLFLGSQSMMPPDRHGGARWEEYTARGRTRSALELRNVAGEGRPPFSDRVRSRSDDRGMSLA